MVIGSYDCVMLHGVVNPGNIEVEDIPELIRIVKAGNRYKKKVPTSILDAVPEWRYQHFDAICAQKVCKRIFTILFA